VIFVVFDLEATCWEGKPPAMIQETLEVGAYKIDSYGEVKGSFSRLIKPVLHPQLSFFCQQLTGIDQADVNRAGLFPAVIEDFQEWIDIYDEDYLLCSWGGFDKRILQQDCKLHRMEEEWLEPHINLKQQYAGLKRLRSPWGLRKAVEREGFEFEDEHHRAMDDAHNLAKLFAKYLDMWQY
jgi:3'-5' exoribonuclease 1